MEKTIRVKGSGKISVRPDTVRIIITQSAIEKQYDAAMRESAEKKSLLTEIIEELGYKKEDLKTLFFDIETATESYQAKDRSWKERHLGYRYTHKMKLEFPIDNEKLGKVLNAIAKCTGKPELSIQHTVLDTSPAKNMLLENEVADSKKKAEILCKAAGVKLNDILMIDYSWGEIELYSNTIREFDGDFVAKSDGIVDNYIDIEPDDIDITDTVTVVWSIG